MRNIKKGFMLCPVMGKTMVIATGELQQKFSAMIKMNEPSADIWKWIEAGKEDEEIHKLYADTYGISLDQAREDVGGVISRMAKAGIFE